MRIYIVKRILSMIPALLFIVLLSFLLLHFSPGDPVERILSNQGSYDVNTPTTITGELRKELTHKLGLDLPVFYFSISDLSQGKNNSPEWQKFFPSITFHSKNQFHNWLFGDGNYTNGILRGDFGYSWISGQKVSAIISSRLGWSLFFTLFSVLLAYIISVPIGLKSAANPKSRFDKTSSVISSVLFSLPSFWIATLLMFTFCNPDVINLLPSSGVGPTGGFENSDGLIYRIIHTFPYLILPTICYTYSSVAFLSGTVKSTVAETLKQDYIRTARAKGVSEKTILRKHAFRNSLLPLIAIFSQVFPVAIGGSVILESLFTIPGMGLAIFQSIASQDYPVVIAVFMITGIITMAGFLFSDILYAFADPRISYETNLMS